MNVDLFLDSVHEVFEGDPMAGGTPREDIVTTIHSTVGGFTSANELAVLKLAASLVPPDECYLEVGSFKGRSTCAAAQGATGPLYVVENYLEFGMLGQQAQRELHANLARYAADADVRFILGDAFEVLRRPSVTDRPIGVYFYDGEHTKVAHYLALGMIEPLLADEALVLVDDATWPMVVQAHERFMAKHPGWTLERRWDAAFNDDPAWANGLHALRYRRPPGTPRRLTPDVTRMLLAQRYAVGPARTLAWKTVHRLPWVVPVAKKLIRKKSYEI